VRSRAVVAAYLACALIWGTTWYGIRACIAPGGYPTLTAVALRFAIAAVVVLGLAARARPWPRGRAWLYLVLAGVLDASAYLLVYLGEERVPGGLAAVVYGTQPLILSVLLAATRVEVLTRRHVIGALVSLAGVAVLALDRLDVSADQAFGVLLVVGSVLAATSYSVVVKRHARGTSNLATTAIFLGVTAVVLGAVALVAGQGVPWPPPTVPTLALVYLALVGSVVAFLVYFWLLDRTSLLVTSTLVFVFPLVALATDAVFGDAIVLGPRAYAGAAITLAGLAVSLRSRAPILARDGR
jgi:drug/metabolite transporter (DMT)-like permease